MRGLQVLWLVGALALVPACKDKSSSGGTGSDGAGGSLAGGNGGSSGSDDGSGGSDGGASAGGNGGSSGGGGSGGASGGSGGTDAGGSGGTDASGSGGTGAGGSGGGGGTSAGGASNNGGTGAVDGTMGGAAGATSGDTASLEVTPEDGGTLTLGDATVTIPPNAVSEPTTITLAEIDPDSVADLPNGYQAEGPMLALLPHGLSFSEPVTITLGHTSTEPPQNLAVLRLDDEADSSWEDVAGVSADSNSISFETQRFCVLLPAMPDGEVIYTESDPKGIGHMLLIGDRLYYSVEYQANDLTHRVHSVRTDGTSPAVVATFDEYNYKIDGLAANASTLFIATGVLSTVPLAGGSVTTFGPYRCGSIAGNNEVVSHLLVDTSTVFCATVELTDYAFAAIRLDGSAVTTPELRISDMIDDGANLLALTGGNVLRIPKTFSNEGTVVIASDELQELGELGSIQAIAADDTYVYALTTYFSTRVSRVWRKPRSGAAIQPVSQAELPGIARGLLLVGPRLYFILDIPATNTEPRQILLARIDKTATNGIPSHFDDVNMFKVVSDGTYVYYARGSQILRMLR